MQGTVVAASIIIAAAAIVGLVSLTYWSRSGQRDAAWAAAMLVVGIGILLGEYVSVPIQVAFVLAGVILTTVWRVRLKHKPTT